MSLWGAFLALGGIAARRVRDALETRRVPLVAMGAAFSFVVMMFNVPIPGGTTGHAVGGVLIALMVGPWAAALAISVALAIQAALFGDGGMTAMGANCVNIAFIMPFAGWVTYHALRSLLPRTRRGVAIAAGVGGYVGLNLAAVATALQFGIQPWIHRTAEGQALYSPFPMSVALPVMALEHLLLFGVVEGLLTGMVVWHLIKASPETLLVDVSDLRRES
jgi:cobalt/nickel transport system permease protein